VGYSIFTLDQLHSSSSATSCASPVIVPCPISERTTRMLTVSSGPIATQTPISGEPSCARATSGPPNGRRKPSARPPVTAADEKMKERRFILMASLLGLRGHVNRLAHLLEGAAAADIGDRGVDVRVRGLGLLAQERRDRHDHARLAVAALRKALDRGDALALDGAYRHRARARRLPVDVHGACAALRHAAAVFRSGESDLLPQHPQQRGAWLHVHLDGFAVDDEARHFLNLL